MPDPRQRIVLRQDRNGRSRLAAAVLGPEGGREPARTPLNGEASLLELVREAGASPVLAERQLRVGVDIVARREKLGRQLLHGRADTYVPGFAVDSHARSSSGSQRSGASAPPDRPASAPSPHDAALTVTSARRTSITRE